MDRETVEKIANLARLKVYPEKVQTYAEQMTSALSHFEELSKIDTSGVEPMVTASPIDFYMRKDEARESLSTHEALDNAPEKSGHLVKVPPVV